MKFEISLFPVRMNSFLLKHGRLLSFGAEGESEMTMGMGEGRGDLVLYARGPELQVG